MNFKKGDRVLIKKKFSPTRTLDFHPDMENLVGKEGKIVNIYTNKAGDMNNAYSVSFGLWPTWIWPESSLEALDNEPDNPPVEVKKEDYDYINPKHYQKYTYQTIEMMEKIYGPEFTANFCEGNAFKYRMRMGSKPSEPVDRDMEKVQWYEAKMTELRAKIIK